MAQRLKKADARDRESLDPSIWFIPLFASRWMSDSLISVRPVTSVDPVVTESLAGRGLAVEAGLIGPLLPMERSGVEWAWYSVIRLHPARPKLPLSPLSDLNNLETHSGHLFPSCIACSDGADACYPARSYKWSSATSSSV